MVGRAEPESSRCHERDRSLGLVVAESYTRITLSHAKETGSLSHLQVGDRPRRVLLMAQVVPDERFQGVNARRDVGLELDPRLERACRRQSDP